MRSARFPRFLYVLVAVAAAATVAGVTTAAAESSAAIVDRMVDAHGGMDAWKNAPSVSFTDAWTSPRSPMVRRANIIVEQGRRRSLIDFPDAACKVAWDGEKAWSLDWKMPTPPRFLLGLTYYFANLPWLVKDPGVVLGEPATATLKDDPTEYTTIRVTYEAGVGDTPDDYYVLYIDPTTHRLHGCEYVVTYPGLVPEGETHTPPHILIYGPLVTVDGLAVPSRFDIFQLDMSAYASCELIDWSFAKPFDPAMVAMPEGAVVDHSMDGAEGNQ